MTRRRCLLAAGLAALSLACGGAPERPADPAAPELAAEWDGGRIELAEIDAQIAERLEGLREQEYELRRGVLKELLTQRLVEAEAARRGMSVEELLRVEVRQRVEEPTAEEIEAFRHEHASRFDGKTRDRAVAEITDAMFRARATRQREAFLDRLWRQAGVRLRLQPPRKEVPVPADAPALGPPDAPVTIVEFTDYECPYCRRAQETVDALMTRFEGGVRLVYRDLPLGIHPRATAAAKAARCAGEQGLFWEYHRDLLLHPDTLDEEGLRRRAVGLGLRDADAFSACLASDRHDAAIQAGLADARRLGVSATPTFFVNGRRFVGSKSFEELAAVIEEELRASGSS